MNIILKFTDEYSYIRIVKPGYPNNNIGCISRNGQISVKDGFWAMLGPDFKEKYTWSGGAGINGGSGYRCHSTNHTSLFDTLQHLDQCFRNGDGQSGAKLLFQIG